MNCQSARQSTAAKILASIIFFGLFFSTVANAATWYVDGTASGLGDGTSWTNAWTSLAAIVGITPGDTIYISGGPSGSTQTYSLSSSWIPAGGILGSRVTYQIGQDASHNGIAIFSYTGSTATAWFTHTNYANVIGDAGDGAMHFKLSNFAQGFNTISDVRLAYLNLNGASENSLNPANNMELDHLASTVTDMNSDHFLYANFAVCSNK